MTTNRMGLEQLSDARLEILRDTFRINAKLCGDDFEAKGYEDSALAMDELLARRKVSKEPVAWVRYCSDGTIDGPLMNYQVEDCRKSTWTPLYAAPQLPAVPVPDDITFEQAMLEVHGLSPAEAFQKAWNKLRGAMLKSATNEP